MKPSIIFEKIAKVLMYISIATLFLLVVSILATIFIKGGSVITWEMVSSLPGGGFYIGKGGGFLNAIVGSLMVVLSSTAIGLIFSIPVVFYLNIYLKQKSRFAYWVRLALDSLFGIPSIVYGAFAFTVMIYFGMRTSLGGGILVTTILIIPIFIRSMDEVAKNFPQDILEASFSLGATRLETIGIVVRQIAPGIATATLLSIGRAIGDAAGVMYTAGFSDSIPESLSQPAATLPLSIFFQLGAPQIEVQNRAYAAALVLTVIVLILSILGRFITNKFSKNKLK
ncbi:MAG: ABC transporter permease subunit [Bacteroidales bacterium]|jgi:phosphate transport system permease protein|nr:ABC transporter permease subunit [Bacteroidales bacterium]